MNEWYETGDAAAWAQAFVATANENDSPEAFSLDEGNLVGWFANAIQRGVQIGHDMAWVELTGDTEVNHWLRTFEEGEHVSTRTDHMSHVHYSINPDQLNDAYVPPDGEGD